MIEEYFKPGEKAPKSGIYTAIHGADCQHLDHELTCIFRDRLPWCRSCDDQVRFTLLKYAPDAASHEDFKPAGGASNS